jgi:hypothetical protein
VLQLLKGVFRLLYLMLVILLIRLVNDRQSVFGGLQLRQRLLHLPFASRRRTGSGVVQRIQLLLRVDGFQRGLRAFERYLRAFQLCLRKTVFRLLRFGLGLLKIIFRLLRFGLGLLKILFRLLDAGVGLLQRQFRLLQRCGSLFDIRRCLRIRGLQAGAVVQAGNRLPGCDHFPLLHQQLGHSSSYPKCQINVALRQQLSFCKHAIILRYGGNGDRFRSGAFLLLTSGKRGRGNQHRNHHQGSFAHKMILLGLTRDDRAPPVAERSQPPPD